MNTFFLFFHILSYPCIAYLELDLTNIMQPMDLTRCSNEHEAGYSFVVYLKNFILPAAIFYVLRKPIKWFLKIIVLEIKLSSRFWPALSKRGYFMLIIFIKYIWIYHFLLENKSFEICSIIMFEFQVMFSSDPDPWSNR